MLKRFYKDLSSELTDEETAAKYVDYYYQHIFEFERALKESQSKNTHLAVVSDSNSFDLLTKRLSLISDKTVLSNDNHGHRIFKTYDQYDQHYLSREVEHTTITVHDMSSVGRWLRQCEPLIRDNRIVYYPNVEVGGFTDELTKPAGSETHFQENLIDFVVRNRKIAEIADQVKLVKRQYVYKIMDVPLPVIDHSDLKTFAKVSTDEADRLEILKDYLREQFLEMELKEGSEGYYAALERIGIEAKRHIRTIELDLRSLRMKRAFQASGVMLGTLSAALFAIDTSLVETIGAIVGTGGGLSVLMGHLQDNKGAERRIKENPFYYLWVLRREVGDKR